MRHALGGVQIALALTSTHPWTLDTDAHLTLAPQGRVHNERDALAHSQHQTRKSQLVESNWEQYVLDPYGE